jgi:DNA-binding transcriptional ArsR family regulator
MQPHERDRRLGTEQTQAISHPLRLRILEISKRERGRSLSVEWLTAALTATREFEHVTASQVNYHRACLQDAELLPTE